MVSSRIQNTTRNIFAGFLYRFVHILMPFITRSVIINILGQDYLGLNTLFTSIFTFLNLTEFGFANALTFRMYAPAKNNDFESLSIFASAIKKVYKVVGILMLTLGIIIMPFLNSFINGSIPDDVNIYILYLIYLINTVIPYLGMGYCTSIFASFQRIDISNNINAAITFLLNVVQILVVFITKKYYFYVLCLPFFTLLNTLFLSYIKRSKYPEISTNKKVDKNLLKEIYLSASALFGHSLNYVIVSSSANIIISSFLGLSALALYGNYYTILSSVIGLIDIVIQSCLPSIGNLLLDNNQSHEYRIFSIISFISYWISGWCSTCLLCLYQPFMKIWMGNELLLPFSTVILFSLYLYSYKARAAIILFKDAAGMWKADMLKPYVSAFMNLIISIFLVKQIGLNGVIVSTILVFFFVNFPWESHVLLEQRYKNIRKHYYSDFVKYFFQNIFIASITCLICVALPFNNLLVVFISNAVLCLLIPNLLWIILNHNKSEFIYIKNKITDIFFSMRINNVR